MKRDKDSLYDLIVIGGGSGGLVAAAGAAHLGARVALVEKLALGGDCLFTGCVPSKTLIASARFAADVRRAADYGFKPSTPQFKDNSFASITSRVQRVIKTVGEHDAPEVFQALGIDVIFGEPRFVSPRELQIDLADGQTQKIGGRRFCVSTGSRPAIPPIEGLSETGFITNEDVFKMQELPGSVIVLGGGPIGLELGQAFARFGSEVTVVEMADRLLLKEDEESSATIERIMLAEGLKILLNTKAVRANRANRHKTLAIEAEGKTREIQAQEILVATGRTPNIEGLNLETAGVKFDRQGISTDQYLRTSAGHIFAAGDVTGHFPFTHMAAYEASVVVRNAILFWPLRQKTDFRVVPWTTFTDPEVARVGLTEKEASDKYGKEQIKIFRSDFSDNDRAQAEDRIRGFTKLVCTASRSEIVGAHIVGPHAGELIHEVVLAMKKRLPVTALGGMIHVYPTLTQVNQKAALDAVLEKLAGYREPLSYYLSFWRRLSGFRR